MEIYLVGGAVRDEILGRTVVERDWVVVGSTPEAMLADGYRQVGRDFPVFLHPETGDEYALARTERKSGPGHTGFEVHADPTVTLEQDLVRRDLTINAMARTADGRLIDPFGGADDLRARLLRHVSAAFEEDPLRVFRVARFAAQLPSFEVADETRVLMGQMAAAGALVELSAERVWGELVKALQGPRPERFILVLRDCGALRPWFQEFERREPGRFQALSSGAQRFAAFVNPLAPDELDALAERLKAPRAHLRVARWVRLNAALVVDWRHAELTALYGALKACGAFRRSSELDACLEVIEALEPIDLADLRQAVGVVTETVITADLQKRGFSGSDLGQALDDARMHRLDAART